MHMNLLHFSHVKNVLRRFLSGLRLHHAQSFRCFFAGCPVELVVSFVAVQTLVVESGWVIFQSRVMSDALRFVSRTITLTISEVMNFLNMFIGLANWDCITEEGPLFPTTGTLCHVDGVLPVDFSPTQHHLWMRKFRQLANWKLLYPLLLQQLLPLLHSHCPLHHCSQCLNVLQRPKLLHQMGYNLHHLHIQKERLLHLRCSHLQEMRPVGSLWAVVSLENRCLRFRTMSRSSHTSSLIPDIWESWIQ